MFLNKSEYDNRVGYDVSFLFLFNKESGSILESKCLHFDPIIFYNASFSIFKKVFWSTIETHVEYTKKILFL